MVESTLFPAAFPSHHLLSAPHIAGLLPAHAESLHKPHNPPSLLLTDYRLESIPPDHYHTLLNTTRTLFRAAVDYLTTHDADAEDDLYLLGFDFASALAELFEPRLEIVKPAKPKKERILTKEAMDADLEPFYRDIAESANRISKLTKKRAGEGGAA